MDENILTISCEIGSKLSTSKYVTDFPESDYHVDMATKITATELARNLTDILDRVRDKGETFEVLKRGQIVAEIKPSERKRITLGEFIELLQNGPKPDPEFWDDVEQAHREMNQPLPMKSPWDT